MDGFSRRFGVLGKRIWRLVHLKGLKGVLVTPGWVSRGWAEMSRDSDNDKLEDSGGLKVNSGPNSVLRFLTFMVWFGSWTAEDTAVGIDVAQQGDAGGGGVGDL